MPLAGSNCPWRLPSWDLFLLLTAVRFPAYESAHSFTQKTAFLLSLASGRCHNIIHSVDLSFERDGSVTINFVLEFLLKNHTHSSCLPLISFKAFSSILSRDDENKNICPVRALLYYLDRSKPCRTLQKHLLIILN